MPGGGGRGDTSRWYDSQVANEQLRRDMSGRFERLSEDLRELVERVALMEGGMEGTVKTIEERLKQGAEAFADVRNTIKDLSNVVADEVRPKKMTRGKIVGWVLSLVSVLSLLAGILWKAAQYPTREEFKEVTKETNTRIESISTEVTGLKYEQLETKALTHRAVTGTNQVETKVDTLVRRRKAADNR
jgi:hypothetical protein